MYCRQCGQKLSAGAAFCQNCGWKISSGTEAKGESPASPQTGGRGGERGERKVLELIIAGAICLLCAGGLMLYLLSGSGSPSSSEKKADRKSVV